MKGETTYKVNFLKGQHRTRDPKGIGMPRYFFKEEASNATCDKSYFTRSCAPVLYSHLTQLLL